MHREIEPPGWVLGNTTALLSHSIIDTQTYNKVQPPNQRRSGIWSGPIRAGCHGYDPPWLLEPLDNLQWRICRAQLGRVPGITSLMLYILEVSR